MIYSIPVHLEGKESLSLVFSVIIWLCMSLLEQNNKAIW